MRHRCQGLFVGLDDDDKEPGLDGPALCRKILEGLDYEVRGFCRCCKLKPTKESGYVQISWGGANKFCVLEDLVLWARGVMKSEGDQCSHLCCEPLCMCPEHICTESAQENNLRKGCVVWWDCPHCPQKILICQHQPPCIKYVPGYLSWNNFLQNGTH